MSCDALLALTIVPLPLAIVGALVWLVLRSAPR